MRGTPFRPNTCRGACGFAAALAAERFCVSLPSPVCVMHVALWAAGTTGSRRRAPLRLGSPHLPELLLKPGGRTGSGSCFRFTTFSC